MEDMTQVYQAHAQTVYKFLMTQTHDPELAEELTQETFYQAVRSIGRFDGSCKISVWLCQIAKHQWYKYLRHHQRELPTDWNALPDVPLPSAEEIAESNHSHMELLRCIHNLPDPMREVVYLRAFGDLSFREIAQVLGRTENWARVTFYRGKERLKGEFKP